MEAPPNLNKSCPQGKYLKQDHFQEPTAGCPYLIHTKGNWDYLFPFIYFCFVTFEIALYFLNYVQDNFQLNIKFNTPFQNMLSLSFVVQWKKIQHFEINKAIRQEIRYCEQSVI